ncbi:MAG: hypothetical protein A2Z18_05430 [Armatimonadetes bacterium RBG_16_58_9]|nr:MAG: hypothetical protein A2Z18_05430 [Armatimonadetes bacterium RBG_16_58_9]
MRTRRRTAVELLMSYPDSTVAEMLGVRLGTLRGWMRIDDFAKALADREREQEESGRRIARQAVVNAAASLCQAAGEPSKTDIKVLLEVLKASGAFNETPDDPGEALAQIIRLASAGQEAADDASS